MSKKENVKSKKIKFAESVLKHDNGFVENIVIAYVDVTSEAKNIIGNFVKSAKLIVSQSSKHSSSEWKDEWKNVSIEVSDNNINVDGNTLVVEFSNGNIVSFYTSEWGWVSRKE